MIGSIQDILYQLAELRRMLAASICYCTVIVVEEEKGRIKVKVDEVETSSIPVLTRKAGESKSSFLPEVGEQGLLLSLGGELNQGVYLGSIATVAQSVGNKSDTHVYKDGSTISYDPDAKKLLVNIKGGVVDILNIGGSLTINADDTTIKGKNISVEAPKVTLKGSEELDIKSGVKVNVAAPKMGFKGSVTIEGPLNAGAISAASIGGAGGELEVDGDLKVNGVSVKDHTHIYEKPTDTDGPGKTGKAQS